MTVLLQDYDKPHEAYAISAFSGTATFSSLGKTARMTARLPSMPPNHTQPFLLQIIQFTLSATHCRANFASEMHVSGRNQH